MTTHRQPSAPAPERIVIERTTPADHFTIIPNALIRDGRLSRFARSVLIEVLSSGPGWRVTASDMWRRAQASGKAHRGEGRQPYLRAFKEMETFGYLTRYRNQREDGTWYTVLRFRAEAVENPGRLTGKTENRAAGVTCDDAVFPQVGPTIQKPGTRFPGTRIPVGPTEVPPRSNSDEGSSTKIMGASSSRSGPTQTAAQRQAAARGYEDKIKDTWQAEMNVYGEISTDGEDALRLYEHLIGDRQPAYPVRYLAKIMADAPNIDSLLSNTPPLDGEDDDGGYAEAHGEAPANAHDVFCPADCGHLVCPRCERQAADLSRRSGLCPDCDREFIIAGRPAF